jgi:hypothetical protein
MSADRKSVRKRMFVDRKVQGALVARVVTYWVLSVISIALMLLCWNVITGPAHGLQKNFDNMWFVYGPAAIASFLLLPVVIADIVRISNRFVGPLLRLRRSMRALARGEYVEPIEFRSTDFWYDFADDFNAIRARLIEMSTDSEPQVEEDEEPLGIGI